MKKKIKPALADQKSALSFKAIRNEYADVGVENYYRNHGDVYENPHFPYIQQLLEQNQQRIDYSKVLDLACGGGEVTMILRGLGFENSVGCDPFTSALFEKNTGKKCLELSFEDIVKGALVSESLVIGSLVNESLVNESLVNESLVNESLVTKSLLNASMTNDSMANDNLMTNDDLMTNDSMANDNLMTNDDLMTNDSLTNDQFSSIISSFAMHLCPEKQLFSLVSQLFLITKNIVIITPHKRPELEALANVSLQFEDFVLTERGKKVFLKSYKLK